MQLCQLVSFASRTLTSAERKYSLIEKELLAQLFGMKHNHQYVFGRKVILWTGLLLVAIYRKPLSSAPKRLQLCDYGFNCTTMRSATNQARRRY